MGGGQKTLNNSNKMNFDQEMANDFAYINKCM